MKPSNDQAMTGKNRDVHIFKFKIKNQNAKNKSQMLNPQNKFKIKNYKCKIAIQN